MINNKKAVKIIEKKIRGAIIQGLKDTALIIENDAKINCPVKTGNLRASITNEVNEKSLQAWVYTNVKYAPITEFGCFFSNNIKILCREGWKKLKYVKIGDEVLTFENGFKKVIDKPIYNLNRKQRVDRITIKTKNKNKLTVTGEHPFLVKNNKGYLWKKARDLNSDDILIEVDI
jgi:hypothetical protein